MRRTAVAFLVSLAIHAALLLVATLPALPLVPDVRIVPVTLQEVKELPLGRRPKVRKRPKKDAPGKKDDPVDAKTVEPVNPAAAQPSPVAPEAPDPDRAAVRAAASASAESQVRRRGDVSAFGPEGSRLVAILRLDRLRATPDAPAYAAALDGLLRLLPDRRLLDEATVDLYRDFDAVLVATPNPFDDTATFLAARHRLRDEALRSALDRGAKAGGSTVRWRKERGHWVGARRSQGGRAAAERDERLLLLPAKGLVVIAAPAYAKLLLEGSSLASDGSIETSGSSAAQDRDRGWGGLVERIDAEDGAVPEDAVFVLTATSLLSPGAVGAGARVEIDGRVVAAPVPVVPDGISLLMGTLPAPFLEIRAEFEDEGHAKSCEAQWPAWKESLLANPLVLLSRVGPLVSSAQLRRDERTVVLRTTTTSEEMLRLLRIVGSLAASSGEARAPGAAAASGLPH